LFWRKPAVSAIYQFDTKKKKTPPLPKWQNTELLPINL
jgi:hypothetical protein